MNVLSHEVLPFDHNGRCTGCGRCVAACPPHVLHLEAEGPNGWGPKHAVLHDEPGCTGCEKCAKVCPFMVTRIGKLVSQSGHNRMMGVLGSNVSNSALCKAFHKADYAKSLIMESTEYKLACTPLSERVC